VPKAAPVLELEIEAVGLTQFNNCRRGKGEHHSVTNRSESPHGPPGHGRRLQILCLAQFPVLELYEGNAHVLAASRETETGHGDDGLHRLLFRFEEMPFHLLYHLQGPLLGGSGRQLNLADDEPLVFIGKEGRGETHEQKTHAHHYGAVHRQIAHRLAEGTANDSLVFRSDEIEGPVEVGEEPLEPSRLAVMLTFLDGLQYCRA